MSFLPFVNAVVLEIHPPAADDGYASGSAGDVARWTGSVEACLIGAVKTVLAGRSVSLVEPTTLTVASDAGVTVERGDLVTFRRGAAAADETRTVGAIADYSPVGLLTIAFLDE